MKLICLNIWGGKLFEPLIEFVKRSAEDTDIFCFQEVFCATGEAKPLASGCRADMFAELERILPGFRGYFAKTEEGWDFREAVSFPLEYGQASFVRNTFPVLTHRQIPIFETTQRFVESEFERPRGMQYLEIADRGDAPLHIFNLHGLLDNGHKRDTEVRLAQFARVRKHVDEAGNRTIVCGDFNARPDTYSIGMFEERMRNLLKEYGMRRTRNNNYADMEKYKDYWGDHIFTTPDIVINNFAVLDGVVSDHLPLMIEFS